MAGVYLVLALITGVVAVKAEERGMRIVFACGCLLNAVGLVVVLAERGDLAWRLEENPCNADPYGAACADIYDPEYRP